MFDDTCSSKKPFVARLLFSATIWKYSDESFKFVLLALLPIATKGIPNVPHYAWSYTSLHMLYSSFVLAYVTTYRQDNLLM